MSDPDSGVSVERLCASTIGQFRTLHDGEDGWCQCVAWWVPSWNGWGERSAAENAQLRQSLFDRGILDGYLIHVRGQLAGWCQAWRRDAFEKIASQFGAQKDAGAWMIGCVLVKPTFRGQGVAKRALQLIVEDLRHQGATSIDAFPKRQAQDAGELWNGPESTYLGLGFRVAKDHPKRPLLRISFS